MDEANTALGAAGKAFAFPLTRGFAGFDSTATFALFNRALAARAAIYDKAWDQALTALKGSFYSADAAANLSQGVRHVFTTSGSDQTNPLFKISQQSADQIIVHNKFITEAEKGDTRVAAKTAARKAPTSMSDREGTHESALYSKNTSTIDIIRQEELILIYAEATIQLNRFSDAVTALNRIRTAAGLPEYSGAEDNKEALIDELLKQRRYSLWGENHRLFDLRRYNRNDKLPNDQVNDKIFDKMVLPLSEGTTQ